MGNLEWIMNRKSIRNYNDKPVSVGDLEIILRAGMAAPSAVNQQLKEFIVINEKAILRQLGEELPYAKMLLHAPAAIVVCADLTKTFDNNPNSQFWIMDCSAATENILLAVEALGLGAVWTAVYPDPKCVENVQRILGLSTTVIPLNVIPLGYPQREEQAKDKWNTDAIHWNKW